MLTLLLGLIWIDAHTANASAETPKATREHCVEVRPFLGGGRPGCRVAVTDGPASMCIKEESGKFTISFMDEGGKLTRKFDYDKKHTEKWMGHREIFFTSSSKTPTPEVRIGLTDAATPGSSVLLVGKARHCLPEKSVHALLKTH